MLGRLGTLALAIVLAVLPSLSRICLTGCDADTFAAASSERPTVDRVTDSEGGGDSECPLHAAPSSPERPAAPVTPAPCQHQQDIASADAAKSLGLALGSDASYTIATTLTTAAAIAAITSTPASHHRPRHPRPVTNPLILRI
jgi:hypothetical protein